PELREGELAAVVGDHLVRIERVLGDVVVGLACGLVARSCHCGRDRDACDEHGGGDDRPSALVHEPFLSRGNLTERGKVRLLSHYLGYAAVTPPSTLRTFPVDLADR